jgi:OOP family OmpA-OmpF porin
MTNKGLAAIAAVSLCAGLNAQAQERGGYFGFGLGAARLKADTGAIDASIMRSGIGSSSTSAEQHDSAWKIYLGYQFNRHFALEGGYADFGRFSLATTTTLPATNTGGNVRANAWSLDAVGYAPLSERLSLFGKLGAQRWEQTNRVAMLNAGAVSPSSISARGSDVTFGTGLRYDFARNVGLRFEWERFVNVGDAATTGRGNIDLIAIGLQYRF